MKKKGTRKVRKNKRTTQRRKNRSYKRMRGGLYIFKSKGLFDRKLIPQNVKEMIEKYTNNGRDQLDSYYAKFLRHKDKTDDIITTFWENNANEIKDNIKTVTKNTEEDDLTSLPISTTRHVKNIIDRLFILEFLPTQIEYEELYNKFYGKSGKKIEKDEKHKHPYKFNGFALAVFLASLIKKMTDTLSLRPSAAAAAVARAPPASSSKPDLTGIPQRYFIWLGPTDKISWIQKSVSVILNDNPYCPSSKRTHLRSVKGEVLDNHNKSVLTYNSQKTEGLTSKEIPDHITEYIRFLQSQTTLTCTYIYIVDTPGKYLYYELQKLSVREEVSKHPKRSSCEVLVTVYVIKQYAEDGICEYVYVEYSYGNIPPPPQTTQYNPCSEIVDIPSFLTEKYVDNVKKELSAAFTGFESAIPLMINTQRGESAQPTQMITTPRIISTGEQFSGICTLMISLHPSGAGGNAELRVAQATTIQSDAFIAVRGHIIVNPSSINQMKVFSITNSDKSIHVHIIVKKIDDHNNLISAEYVSDNGETYEIFNNQIEAETRAREKAIQYQQVAASGPSTSHSYTKSSYHLP